jgi:hypothetical protein
VLADLLDHLAEGRRIELSDGGRPPGEVALERFVRERRSPSTVEEQHAFLHRSQDQVLHVTLVFAGALAPYEGVGGTLHLLVEASHVHGERSSTDHEACRGDRDPTHDHDDHGGPLHGRSVGGRRRCSPLVHRGFR